MIGKASSIAFFMILFATYSVEASDKDAISTAKSLASFWSDIPNHNFVVLECQKNTIKLLRINTQRIQYDVVRTDSLVSPYKIIIDMEVSSQTNEPSRVDLSSPNAIDRLRNEVCYNNIDEALRHVSDGDFAEFSGGGSRYYLSRLVYGYSDEGYRLLSATPSMTAVIVPGAFQSRRNSSVWGVLIAGR